MKSRRLPAEARLPQTVQLRDGTALTIRLATKADVPYLQAMHLRLSPRTMFLRYFSRFKELSLNLAAEMCLNDPRHISIVAYNQDNEVIAIVHGVVCEDNPAAAEVGILVEDAYQQRGLGTHLLRLMLQHAYVRGIKAFRATVHVDNLPMRRLVDRCDLPHTTRYQDGAWVIEIALLPPENPRILNFGILRRFVPGHLPLSGVARKILIFELELILNVIGRPASARLEHKEG